MNFRKLIEIVANFYDIKPSDICGIRRKKDIVRARQVVCYLARKKLRKSYRAIGRGLGHRDHTTAIHSFKKIEEKLKQNENLRVEIRFILRSFKKQIQYKKQHLEYFFEKEKKEKPPKRNLLHELSHLSKVKFSSNQIKRQKDMLRKYKNGWTFADIARKYQLSRERVRQIIKKVLLYEAKEIIDQGEKLDLKKFFIEEKKKHIEKMKEKYGFIQKKDLIKKDEKWSRDYDYCRKCATTAIKYRSNGYCKRCYPKTEIFKEYQRISRLRNIKKIKKRVSEYSKIYSKRPEVIAKRRERENLKFFGGNREKTILRDGERCRKCGLSREENRRKSGKDLYVLHIKDRKDNNLRNLITLCSRCFTLFVFKKSIS